MKRLIMALATILMMTGFTSAAMADPGRSNDRRYDNHGRYERIHKQYDHRNDRDYRRYDRRPVIVHRAPARPPEPVIYFYGPHHPGFGIFFPNMSIQIR